jgi:hypothetical protein
MSISLDFARDGDMTYKFGLGGETGPTKRR